MKDNNKVWIGLALFVVVVGAGFYARRFFSAPSPAVADNPPAAEAPAPPAAPSAPPGPSLPKLEDSDDAFRARAAALSSDVRYADWLKRDSLIQRAASALAMVEAGKVPSDGLSFLAPRKQFMIKTKGDEFFLDARSYSRYDKVADVIGSLDARAAAKIFTDFKPLFQEAYRGLGGGGDVSGAFAHAVSELSSAPSLGAVVPLKPSEKGIVYVYADEALERLSPAQKQLMRMGPRNQKKIQMKLREIGGEIAMLLAVPVSARPKPAP